MPFSFRRHFSSVKVSRPKQVKNSSPSVSSARAQLCSTGRICSAANSPRFDHNISAHASGSGAVGDWQCCTTPLPVNLCQKPPLRTAAAAAKKSARESYSSNTACGYRFASRLRLMSASAPASRICLGALRTSVSRWSACSARWR
ncbi:Uncharacterised protein [Neisseria meningitidis]|nr:Uncharacterised protein [Neisseria meningitidis]CWQ75599.1 Uncharacterised protein [Neisseria meningitidis]CWQ76204.1 Uncharacterised protein [Neisseria meningitidis]